LAVKVPVTVSDPEIPTLVQVVGSRPSQDGSTLPFTVRQDEVTVQVPTTLPPQGDTLWQVDVPPLPPVPGPLVLGELHAAETIAAPMATARKTDSTFIGRLLANWKKLAS
jgi:hypothetical protein